MTNAQFVRHTTGTESAALSSLDRHVAGNPSTYVIL
jgi:hypothetical protein